MSFLDQVELADLEHEKTPRSQVSQVSITVA